MSSEAVRRIEVTASHGRMSRFGGSWFFFLNDFFISINKICLYIVFLSGVIISSLILGGYFVYLRYF